MARYSPKQLERLDLHLPEIGLSVRTSNMLEERGILTVRELLMREKADLMEIPNFGEKTFSEVMSALARLGFYAKGKEPVEEALEDPTEKRRRQIRESYGITD